MWCDPLRFSDTFKPDNEAAYLETHDVLDDENEDRIRILVRDAPSSTHPNILEVGCMHGDFLLRAAKEGYVGKGLDLSRTAVAHAEKSTPGVVEYGTLDATISDATVDVVAAFNVIEHMDAPHDFLEHARRVLRPGGVLILETPRQESIFHHIMFNRGRVFAKDKNVDIGVYPGTHIFKFGNRAWRRILDDRDFELISLHGKSTPTTQLLAKRKPSIAERIAIISFDFLARITRLENRLILTARRAP
jgi:2-polyprenyl-3-methyl-5-hydroxy-6-metoxy-1,4-benzoquinol methylase